LMPFANTSSMELTPHGLTMLKPDSIILKQDY